MGVFSFVKPGKKAFEFVKDKYNVEKIIGHYQVDDKKECPSFDVPGWLEKNGLV